MAQLKEKRERTNTSNEKKNNTSLEKK